MVKFLHTGDWHLGMTRHFFSEGVQERFSQARFDAVREIGRVADEEECEFVVVCGDVFESNLVDRQTISRAIEALKSITVPVYLLPGNHDPLDAASIYRNETFQDQKPDHVHVIEDATPIQVHDGVEIVGVPWTSKRPLLDQVAAALAELEPAADRIRICVAHGAVDSLSPDQSDPARIVLETAQDAIDQNIIQYLALGDRHSVTEVGHTGRIWYAGSPEPTAYREDEPGYALVTTLDAGSVDTKKVRIGKWTFTERKHVHLNTTEDVDELDRSLADIPDKERTVVKLRLEGSLSLSLSARIEHLFEEKRDLLAALEVRDKDLFVTPEDQDFEDLGFSGFASSTVVKLRTMSEDATDGSMKEADALRLLIRLAGKQA